MVWLLFGASGRISRPVYQMAVLFWIVVIGCATTASIHLLPIYGLLPILVAAVPGALSLALLTLKRLQDASLPRPLAGLLLFPGLSVLLVAVLCLIPGKQGPNSHGPRPDHAGH